MKLSMITCTVTGTIGGYTVTKETMMKQIDTAQLDITACQAQAAEYHARGFNCAPVSYTHLTLPTTSRV